MAFQLFVGRGGPCFDVFLHVRQWMFLLLFAGDRWEVYGQLGGALGSIKSHFSQNLRDCLIMCLTFVGRSKNHLGIFSLKHFSNYRGPRRVMQGGGERRSCRMSSVMRENTVSFANAARPTQDTEQRQGNHNYYDQSLYH